MISMLLSFLVWGGRKGTFGMRVELLGTGGFHPNERRQTACVMFPEIGLVFDAGTSAFRIPPRLQTESLDIFLSHAHLDHIAGLTFLLPPLLTGQLAAARLWGMPKTLRAVREHLFAPEIFPLEPPYEYCELEVGTSPKIPVGENGLLTLIPLKHPGGSVGYRVDWPDYSFAYITDTTVDGSYTEFIRGVDLLLHECYFSDAMADWALKTGHSHTTQVAELARDAGVQRMVLMHIDPQQPGDDPIDLQLARSIFPATELAEDGCVLEL